MSRLYNSQALVNITGMAPGPQGSFRQYQNDIWHWFKHASSFVTPPDVFPPVGHFTVDDYLNKARELGRMVASGQSNTYVKVRESTHYEQISTDFLIFSEAGRAPASSLFMVMRCHDGYGELVTLFSPSSGKNYFDSQDGELLH